MIPRESDIQNYFSTENNIRESEVERCDLEPFFVPNGRGHGSKTHDSLVPPITSKIHFSITTSEDRSRGGAR